MTGGPDTLAPLGLALALLAAAVWLSRRRLAALLADDRNIATAMLGGDPHQAAVLAEFTGPAIFRERAP